MSCPYCLTYRIYPFSNYLQINTYLTKNFLLSFLKYIVSQIQGIFSFKTEGRILAKVQSLSKLFIRNKKNRKISCKCKKIEIRIYWFSSIVCVCKFCITSTSRPFHKVIDNKLLSKIKFIVQSTIREA